MIPATNCADVVEWSKTDVLKTSERKLRGFESYHRRQLLPSDEGVKHSGL